MPGMIDKLCNTIAECLGGSGKEAGFTVWPSPVFNPIEAEMYLAKYFYERFYESVKKLEKEGYCKADIARMLKAPSRIAQTTWPMSSIKLASLNKEQRINLVLGIMDFISFYRKDVFCEKKKNLLYSEPGLERVFNEIKVVDLQKEDNSEEFKRELSKLNAALFSFTELLYFAIHAVGHEFHGPYNIGKNEIMVVREFYDLKPDFWPFTSPLPFDSIKIWAVYNSKTNMEFDFFNRIRSSTPVSENLRKFSIKLNGRLLSEAGKIKEVTREIEASLKKGIPEIAKLEKTALMKKYVEAYFFILKPLQDKLGKDWRPPLQLYEEIESNSRKKLWQEISKALQKSKKLPLEEFKKKTATIFDPR